MNRHTYAIPCRARKLCNRFVAILLILAGTNSARAAWRNVDTANAYNAYNNAFLYQQNGYEDHFATIEGGATSEDFWRLAEEIEVIEDGHFWALNNDTSIAASMASEIEGLMDGFEQLHGDNWTSNTYNDDINVATLAAIRAYAITGSSKWLTDAENNNTAVWARAQAGDGGLCENTGGGKGCYENSSANWTFVIASWLIDHYNGHTGSYAAHAASVYTWAKANLYQSSTGQIYDAKDGVTGNYTYNYGYAIGAGTYEADSGLVSNAASYLMANLISGTAGGQNILTMYGTGNQNDSGFNGIVFRWTNVAYITGYMPSGYLAWAQANINQAWSIRNSTSELSWNDWWSPTPPPNQVYSWDASCTLSGMFNVPATA